MNGVADDTPLIALMKRVQAGDPDAYQDLLDAWWPTARDAMSPGALTRCSSTTRL
jgi:hypothetical protein